MQFEGWQVLGGEALLETGVEVGEGGALGGGGGGEPAAVAGLVQHVGGVAADDLDVRAAAGAVGDLAGDHVVGEAGDAAPGEVVQLLAFRGEQPERADGARVDVARGGAGDHGRVDVQRVEGRRLGLRERGAGRCGVGDRPPVLGGDGDTALGGGGQLADGGRDAVPVGVGGRVLGELAVDQGVVGEIAALLLLDGTGGRLDGQPGGGGDRTGRDQDEREQQPAEQAPAERDLAAGRPGFTGHRARRPSACSRRRRPSPGSGAGGGPVQSSCAGS